MYCLGTDIKLTRVAGCVLLLATVNCTAAASTTMSSTLLQSLIGRLNILCTHLGHRYLSVSHLQTFFLLSTVTLYYDSTQILIQFYTSLQRILLSSNMVCISINYCIKLFNRVNSFRIISRWLNNNFSVELFGQDSQT